MENPSGVGRQIGTARRGRKCAGAAFAAAAFACGLLFFPASAAPPLRVVSTNLCADEYVFRLVPRGHIAALSFEAADRHPVVSTIADQVGGIPAIRPALETVLRYKPDLIVMYDGAAARLQASLTALHVPLLLLPFDDSLADVRRTTAMLGEKLGARAQARALLAAMDAKLAAARAEAARPSIRTLIYEPNGYAASGGLTRELMGIGGLSDAAPGLRLTRGGQIPVEAVVAAAPELLILSGERATRDAQANLVQHHPALAALEARARWDRLTPLLCAGPWSAEAAVRFARMGRSVR